MRSHPLIPSVSRKRPELDGGAGETNCNGRIQIKHLTTVRKSEGQVDQDFRIHTHQWGSPRHLLPLIKEYVRVEA